MNETAEIPSTEQAESFHAKKPNTKPKYSNMFSEAKELQDLLFASTKGRRLKPIERSALARVWKELGEFRLRLQGKGPPKAVDYGAKSKARKPGRGFSEAPIVSSDTTSGSVPDKTA